MHIIYVDDEEQAIHLFEKTAEKIDGVQSIHSFNRGEEAMEFVRRQQADIAFLDIQMPEINGIHLAEKLQEIQENIHIVFVTSHESYALQAFQVNAVGYILKPYDKECLEEQIRKLKQKYHIKEERTVYFQTIPRFELFIDGQLFPISAKKAKELLALLVDFSGSSLTSEQAITYLWEDRSVDQASKALLRMTAKRLRDILTKEKIEFILIEENGVRAIDTRKVSCDYYQILNGSREAMKKYQGEYMVEYSWAEETNAKINKLISDTF